MMKNLEIKRKDYNDFIIALQTMVNDGNRDNFLNIQKCTNRLLLSADFKTSTLVNQFYTDVIQRTLANNPLNKEEMNKYFTEIINSMRADLDYSSSKINTIIVKAGF